MKSRRDHAAFDNLLGLGVLYPREERERIHGEVDSTVKEHAGRHREDPEHSIFGY
jgi:hypothetical protein